MIVYRISRNKYAHDLSGAGTKISGARWNSQGNPMLYTAGSISLAILEIAVHLPLEQLPTGYQLITIEIPDSFKSVAVDAKSLPINWSLSVHAPTTQNISDAFLGEREHLVLKVSSAIVPGECKYLINPLPEDFYKVKIIDVRDMNFDCRLFNPDS